MRKLLLSFIVCGFALTSTNANAQAVQEGNVIIDAYYGFPNLYTSIYKGLYANSGTEINLTIGGIGPLGGRIEYLVADKFGVGLDIAYDNTTINYQEAKSVYNTTTMVTEERTYDYDYATRKIGGMVTFNYHFLDHDALDAYAMIGAGYKNRNFSFESTDPDYTAATVSGLIPIAFRIGGGMRYFFTPNIGANLAIGIGQGGIVNGGISVKF
jgi:hypothetical protein